MAPHRGPHAVGPDDDISDNLLAIAEADVNAVFALDKALHPMTQV